MLSVLCLTVFIILHVHIQAVSCFFQLVSNIIHLNERRRIEKISKLKGINFSFPGRHAKGICNLHRAGEGTSVWGDLLSCYGQAFH